MTPNALSQPWLAVWSDLQSPDGLWQLVVLVIGIVVGWGAARILRDMLIARAAQLSVARIGQSFAHVLPPLFSLALIAIAKPLFAQWQRVNLLRVAIPLLASLALIRLVF